MMSEAIFKAVQFAIVMSAMWSLNDAALNEEDNHIATACVGHCDVSYSMDCPRGKRVAPRDLTYHAKETSTQCPTFKQNPDMMCQSSKNCCGYNGGDCGQPFSYSKAFGVFNNCSGYQNCGWFRAESVDFGAHCSYRNYSNYISASFSCIREETFIDICSEASRQGKSVSLLYNGSVYRSAIGNPQVCHCVITTSDCDSPARLKFRVIDLRLHSYNDIASCEPQSLVMLQDTATSQSLRCQPNYFQKGFRDVFHSSSPYVRVSLYNQPGVFPTQVWLEVTDEPTSGTSTTIIVMAVVLGIVSICLIGVLFYFKCYKNRRSTQSTYERSIPTSAVTEYEMPVSICKNTEEGNKEHAVEFRVSAVYHTIPN
ncbi:uncharacterized protein LOC128185598 isoform X2 [Crassostrea angulata]|uniref:uncharacterized protein LOC128185598 isoform X2 n=1 Tax=Magallana angulata TaxID=2784310 RepID=UPI0022B1C58B|nr:uncharacterized protein LOC128185598 isoform X2 [Crassostrea angulata]